MMERIEIGRQGRGRNQKEEAARRSEEAGEG
jgi:hypothetical protein